MKNPTPLFTPPMALLLGAAGLLALASCMDRHPAAVEMAGRPLMSHAPITIDGTINPDEWAHATCFEFDAPSTGGTTVRARFCAQHDADNWYWSLVSTRPWSNGGDVLRIFLRTGEGAPLYDEIRWQQSYAGGDRHRRSSDNYETSHLDAIQDGVVVRSGSGGSTSFEGRKPRIGDVNDHDLHLFADIQVMVTVEQSDRSGTSGWQSYAFGDPPPPPVQGNVKVVVEGIPPEITDRIAVVARDANREADLTDTEQFDVQPCWITQPGTCEAWFNVTGRPVFSAEPTRIRYPEDHILWANHRPVEVFSTAALFQATVFVQDPSGDYGVGGSFEKVDTYLNQAFENAKNVPSDGAQHTITIEVRKNNVAVVTCNSNNITDGTYLFAGTLFNPSVFSNIPAIPGPNSPGIAGYVGLHGGPTTPCQMVLANNLTYIVKGDDYQGNTFSGSCTTEGPCNTTPDFSGGYVVQHYIPDPVGDGNPDSNYMTFGLVGGGSNNHLHWKVNTIGLKHAKQRTSTWEFQFIYRTSEFSVEQTLMATVVCNKSGDGSCVLDNVNPRRLADMVFPVGTPDGFGRVDPSDSGIGYAQILLNVSGVVSARLRVRSVDSESPREFVPDEGLNDSFLNIVNGYAHWNKQADIDRGLGSQSVFLPF
jgi:hypothetical protein